MSGAPWFICKRYGCVRVCVCIYVNNGQFASTWTTDSLRFIIQRIEMGIDTALHIIRIS